MKILILSWEYPPRNIGGISTHVYNLSHSLVQAGNEIHVITCGKEGAEAFEDDNGVQVHRVEPYNIPSGNFIEWVNHLNYAMIEKSIKILKESGKFDLLHAHDWLVAFAARTLKEIHKLPLISTIHSTEHGRNNGIYTDMQKYIASVEDFLLKESNKVICCSNYMKEQIASLFNYSLEDINVIPNGVPAGSLKNENILSFRRNYASDEEKLIFFIGRHTYEKGIHLLIEAIPRIIPTNSHVKFIIAGVGPMTEELKYKAYALGVADKIVFTGYLNDFDKNSFYQAADAVVIPSLYEPFGIVALEAMVEGCPVIAARTGGLEEIITDNITGKLFDVSSSVDLADAIIDLLNNDPLRGEIVNNAFSLINEKYTWEKVASLTADTFQTVVPRKRRAPAKKTTKKASEEQIDAKSKKESAVKKTTTKRAKATIKDKKDEINV